MADLIERAKADARQREKEKRERDEQARQEHNAAIRALNNQAAEFVARKLDTEVDASDLQRVTGARTRGYDCCWHLTIDGIKLEVTKNDTQVQFGLWRAPATAADEPTYIKRLADLVEATHASQ